MKKRLTVFALLLSIVLSMLPGKEKLALVLSGGGARGIAHVAVLKELDKRGIVPDMVIGTSMGALVGAFYASGWSGEEIENLLLDTDLMGLLIKPENAPSSIDIEASDVNSNILVTGFGKEGLGTANGLLNDQAVSGFIRKNLSKVLEITDFDGLSIPFRAIGTDIVNSSEIVFSSGSLYDAMRSSMSLPMVFSPVRLADGSYVMDGGMVNNLPVDTARKMGADVVLAVDVNDARHKYGTEVFDYETLTGAFNAFSSVITLINSVPKYDIADLVIVPDVGKFSTIQFDKTEEILMCGEKAVAENLSFFDMLEMRFGGQERALPYSDRPVYSIKGIDKAGITGFDSRLDSFIGRSVDDYTIGDVEKLLEEIRRSERLKKLGYRLEKGIIMLEPEYYKDMNGQIGLGASGDLGVVFNGYSSPFLSVNPYLSASVQYRLSQRSLLSFSIVYRNTLSLETRYSVHISKRGYFFAGLDIDVGNLSVLSSQSAAGHIDKNDAGAGLIAGISFSKPDIMTLCSYIGFDYIHPASLLIPKAESESSSTLIGYQNIVYPYAAIDFAYKGIDWKKTMADGLDFSLFLSAGADIPLSGGYSSASSAVRLGYEASMDFYGEIGNDSLKSITEVRIDTKRRYSMLASSYSATKSGKLTHDYVLLSEGIRYQIMGSRFYAEGGLFAEYSERYRGPAGPAYYDYFPSLAPFSLLESWSAGVRIGAGFNSPIGHIFADVHMAAGERFSMAFSVGIR